MPHPTRRLVLPSFILLTVLSPNGQVYKMAAQLQKHVDLFEASPQASRDAAHYGSFDLGRHLLLGRRMLEAGVTFVEVTSYDWNTHGDNFSGHLSLMSKYAEKEARPKWTISQAHDGWVCQLAVRPHSGCGRRSLSGLRSRWGDAGCGGGEPKSGGFVQGTPLILLFDWQTGKRMHTHKFGADNDGFVYDLAFHPAGFLMAVTSGQPGSGKLLFHRPGDAQPFFLTDENGQLPLAALIPREAVDRVGHQRRQQRQRPTIGKNKEYLGNWSPLHVWDFPHS